VRCGGDTDTLGAMAGAVAAARTGASAIPSQWLDALEEGPKGRSHVERLAYRHSALADAQATPKAPAAAGARTSSARITQCAFVVSENSGTRDPRARQTVAPRRSASGSEAGAPG
jgi:hypothetical protein